MRYGSRSFSTEIAANNPGAGDAYTTISATPSSTSAQTWTASTSPPNALSTALTYIFRPSLVSWMRFARRFARSSMKVTGAFGITLANQPARYQFGIRIVENQSSPLPDLCSSRPTNSSMYHKWYNVQGVCWPAGLHLQLRDNILLHGSSDGAAGGYVLEFAVFHYWGAVDQHVADADRIAGGIFVG